MDLAIEFVVGVAFWAVAFHVARHILWKIVTKHGK